MKKTVLVTAAAKGTGYTIAERFAKEGYAVIITSRNEEASKKAAAEIHEKYGVDTEGYALRSGGVFTIKEDDAQITEVFKDMKEKGYDIESVILNAADLGIGQQAIDLPVEDFMNVVATNVGWNFCIARTAARYMKETGGGSVVFINSNTAYRAIPDRSAYSASKSGALGLMRALALDFGKYNIKVNAVLPGMIKTDRWYENKNGVQQAPSRYTPLQDIASYEDIANAAYFLGSDQSRNTTGTELTVDGGNMIQLYPIIPDKD